MKKEVSCSVIRDILPLYADDVVSRDTAELVQEHLADCPACQAELDRLHRPVSLPLEGDAQLLKRFKKSWQRAKLKVSLKTILCVAVLSALVISYLWYTRPMTLEELYPELDTSAPGNVFVQCFFDQDHPRYDELAVSFELEGDHPAVQEILSLVMQMRFHRKLINLAPVLKETHAGMPRDWKIFYSGSLHGLVVGWHYANSSWIDLNFQMDGQWVELRCRADDQEWFAREIYGLLEANIPDKS